MRLPENPEVLIMGHPLLFEMQPEVATADILTDEFQHNLQVMEQSHIDQIGVGLASPQIGWGVRVLTIGISEANRQRYPAAPDIDFQYWINPRIEVKSDETSWGWEGCLSLPGVRGWVQRHHRIEVSGFNERGEPIEKAMEGFEAKVFQHEFDHLDGILFTMRIDDPGLIIPNEAIFKQDEWADDWPTAAARNSPRGALSPVR
ncbi:peptide deformylase [Spongorhabdus nitratireducens]